MLLLDWFDGALASLGLRQKVARSFFLGLDNADKTKLLRMLNDEMEQPSSSPTAPWSDLPPELLGLVFLRLPTRADRAHFPAVCHQWRSSMRQCHLPPMSPIPWSVLPGGNIVRFSHDETFHVPDATRYHNSCGEWLLLSRDDASCFMLNPFTNATVELPSLSSYISYDEHVETVNVPDEMEVTWMNIKDLTEISVITLIVCSKHLIAALVAIEGLGTIALCRPGAAAWSVSAHEQCMWLSDMVFFQGKLYAIDTDTEDLFSIDIVDELDNDRPRVSRIERIIEGDRKPPQSYPKPMLCLLESHGTLLMVRREMNSKGYMVHSAGSSEFEVFDADLKHLSWAELRSLGNETALFIGQGCSSAVHVSPYDLSRDCIFFMDDYTVYTDGRCLKTTTYYGLYDMKDGKVYSPFCMVSRKSGYTPATWLFSEGKLDNLRTTEEQLQEPVEPPTCLPALYLLYLVFGDRLILGHHQWPPPPGMPTSRRSSMMYKLSAGSPLA